MNLPIVYLAGAIRDTHPEDIAWREDVIRQCAGLATFLNPLAGKKLSEGQWTVSGVPSTPKLIVAQDFWCVDRADIVVANLLSLSEGYPSIGTLMELGRATTHALIYSIISSSYVGHGNKEMFKGNPHPFIQEKSSHIFPDVPSCITFLAAHLPRLSGMDPSFGDEKKKVGFHPEVLHVPYNYPFFGKTPDTSGTT